MITSELQGFNLKSSVKRTTISPVSKPNAPNSDPNKTQINELFSTSLRPNFKPEEESSASSSSNSTEDWANQGAEQIAKIYFDQDYSQAQGQIGKYDLDPSQSRIRSALDLGQSPFAHDSNTIADNYGFSTAISSGGSSEDQLDLLGLNDQDENKDDDFDELGEDLLKEFDRIDRHHRQIKEQEAQVPQLRPKETKEIQKEAKALKEIKPEKHNHNHEQEVIQRQEQKEEEEENQVN